MAGSIFKDYQKNTNPLTSLLGLVKPARKEEIPSAALAKLPANSVPRPHGSAAGLAPIWD